MLRARPSGQEPRSARQRGPGSPVPLTALDQRAPGNYLSPPTHSPHIRGSAVASRTTARTTDVRVKYRRPHGAVQRPAEVYCLLARAPVAPRVGIVTTHVDPADGVPQGRHIRAHNIDAAASRAALLRPEVRACRNPALDCRHRQHSVGWAMSRAPPLSPVAAGSRAMRPTRPVVESAGSMSFVTVRCSRLSTGASRLSPAHERAWLPERCEGEAPAATERRRPGSAIRPAPTVGAPRSSQRGRARLRPSGALMRR